jgi:hypothetical protein
MEISKEIARAYVRNLEVNEIPTELFLNTDEVSSRE